MYSAERTFFCKLTAIIQHIVAQTSRLRLPTAKIQFQRTPVPHIIPPAKSANARRKRMAREVVKEAALSKMENSGLSGSELMCPDSSNANFGTYASARLKAKVRCRKLSGTGRLSISSLRRERTARRISIKQNLQLLRFESNHKSGSLLCPTAGVSRSSRTRWQIGGVILSGLTPKLETCLWRASTTVRYGILFQKCQRQGS